MKNYDKAIANYAKQFTKNKKKSPILQIEDIENFTASPSLMCNFREKKYDPNE